MQHRIRNFYLPKFVTWEEFTCKICFRLFVRHFLKSTQYKKLAPNACGSLIKIWNLANHMKKQNKKHQNAKSIGEKLRVWCSLFHFFLWFARFQILMCEPQSIWRKLLVLSWLFKPRIVYFLPYFSWQITTVKFWICQI